MKKKIVSIVLESYLELEGTIPDVIKYLQEKEAYWSSPEEAYSNICINKVYGYGDDSDTWELVGNRLETDSEYKDRIAKENLNDAARKERDLKELDRLKKLYEGGQS